MSDTPKAEDMLCDRCIRILDANGPIRDEELAHNASRRCTRRVLKEK